jgi:hypothetical protein
MLDVHAPHEKMHGFKDFFLHLFTITIGLLIALSLEGCVEWQHHRHLVHEAEAGLRGEIKQNSDLLGSMRQQVRDQQKQLGEDLAALAQMKAHPTAAHNHLGLSFRMQTFDDVAWRTAQTTGAFAYMPYNDARTYSDIYATQDELYKVQQRAVNDVMRAASLVVTEPTGAQPTPAQINELTDRIGMIQMRLILLNSLIDGLDKTYQKYESQHT